MKNTPNNPVQRTVKRETAMAPGRQADMTLVGRLTRAECVLLRLWAARLLPQVLASAVALAAALRIGSLTSAASPMVHLLFAAKLCSAIGGLVLVVCAVAGVSIALGTRAQAHDVTIRFAAGVVSIARLDGTMVSLPAKKITLQASRIGVIATSGKHILMLLPYRVLTAEQLAILVEHYDLLGKTPPPRRPRQLSGKAGIALIGGAASLAALLAVFVIAPGRDFAATFDSNLADNMPFDAKAVIGDPALHEHLLRTTGAAFAKGGWPAATMTLKMVMISRVLPYASDDQVLAYERAKLALATKLAADPATCLRYFIDGDLGGKLVGVEAETATLNEATWSAVRNGFERKRLGVAWYSPSPTQVNEVWRTIEFGRYPLSHAEIQLLTYAGMDQSDPNRLPAPMLCSATLKAEQNVLAFVPASDAAFAARILASQKDRVVVGPRINPASAAPHPQQAGR